MSMMVSFVLSFFPRDVLDEILNLIESVSEDFPSYSYINLIFIAKRLKFEFLLLKLSLLNKSETVQDIFAKLATNVDQD